MAAAAAAAVESACTQRSQLVAKVRASPNNGFPHEEQIGGTIYLSGALANVCILTREPPQIFNLRAHSDTPVHARAGAPFLLGTRTHIQKGME